MRKIAVIAVVFIVAGSAAAVAQQKSLASTLNVYVFPEKGQNATQQSEDEATCYNWAVQNTGVDPFNLQKQAQQQQQQAQQEKSQAQQQQQQAAKVGKGAGAAGAVGGAAAGALIGEIASDDAGKGAAYGAAAGLLIARRRGREANAQAQAQAQQNTQQTEQKAQQQQAATAEQMTNFKKAFTTCLEAKSYIANY